MKIHEKPFFCHSKICDSFNETIVFLNRVPIRHLFQADAVHRLKRSKKWQTPFLCVLGTSFVEIIRVVFKFFIGFFEPLPQILLAGLALMM